MTRLQEKARGHVKQAVGQIIGNEKMVLEGKEQVRRAEKKETADPQEVGDQKRE